MSLENDDEEALGWRGWLACAELTGERGREEGRASQG